MRLDPIILTKSSNGYARYAIKLIRFYQLADLLMADQRQVKPDDHSEVVPLLPIPNRKVKRLCADDSAGSRVKVGHCQAINRETRPTYLGRVFCFIAVRTSRRLCVVRWF